MTQKNQPATVQAGASTRPVLMFVLGFGRSGTSALTRALALSGGAVPSGMVGATENNPTGNWEPRAAHVLNAQILHSRGSSAFDPTMRMEEESEYDDKEKAAWIGKIRSYLDTLPAAPFVVVKEGRLNRLTDLWFEAARQSGYDVAPVIALRRPQEVIPSFAKQIGITPELTVTMWLKTLLLVEKETRGMPRVVVEYPNLIEDWRREFKRVSAALSIDLSNGDEGAIDEFLAPDLRHHRVDGPAPEPYGTDWISTVYETLHAAAQDKPLDESAMDRVFDEYRSAEHGFRTVFDEFQRTHKLNRRFVRPSVVKLIGELSALKERRKGTWA